MRHILDAVIGGLIMAVVGYGMVYYRAVTVLFFMFAAAYILAKHRGVLTSVLVMAIPIVIDITDHTIVGNLTDSRDFLFGLWSLTLFAAALINRKVD